MTLRTIIRTDRAIAMSSTQQLTLDVTCPPSLADQTFVEAPVNAKARQLLFHWRDDLKTSECQGILLSGPSASGKTFLLSEVFRDQPAIWISADRLEAVLAQPFSAPLLIVDNADYAADPILLTRLIDNCREQGVSFVLAGTGKPENWAIAQDTPLKDLLTRLSALPLAVIESPDQELMKRVLLTWMQARQLKLSEDLADYIADHLKRSFAALTIFTERLDAEALERNKSINRSLVQSVLEALGEHTLS
ncbi:MAG: hypothetical protein MRY72_03525 [Aquisalinus sp.]|nr:hypothetical protein [Aquisalinus sp.]